MNPRTAWAVLLLCYPLFAQTAVEHNRRGAGHLRQGRFETALKEFQEAAKLDPDDPAIQFNVGLALFRMNRPTEALEPLGRAVSHTPQARYLRGVILFSLNRLEACARELEPLRADPAFGEHTLFMLVEAYRRLKHGEPSRQAFVELTRHYPKSAYVHRLMGVAYEDRDADQQAVEEFQKAIEISPSMPDVAFAIGFIHFTNQRYPEARQWMERELALQPCYAPAHHYLGEIELAEERWTEAGERYRKALQCNPDTTDSYIGLGILHERHQQWGDAVRMYRDAVARRPEDPKVRFKLGNALRRAGRLEEARAELKLARELPATK